MEKFLWNDPEIEQLLLNDAEKETLEKFIGADAELSPNFPAFSSPSP